MKTNLIDDRAVIRIAGVKKIYRMGTNEVAALQGRGNDLEHGLDRAHRVVAIEAGAIGDMADEFLLVHTLAAPAPARRDSHASDLSL